MRILTSSEMLRAETLADERGISFLRLMENAGAACARVIRESYPLSDDCSNVCIVCGKGKNGGDGFVIARKLSENGYTVSLVFAMGLPAAENAAEMLKKAKPCVRESVRYDLTPDRAVQLIRKADVIVDAVFGTGFNGKLSADISVLFDEINAADGHTVSVDIPSGLDSDCAEVRGNCIRAGLTVSMSALKMCHTQYPSRSFCGHTTAVDIGIASDILDEAGGKLFLLSQKTVRRMLPERSENSHKGTYGKLLIVAGSYSMPGAAVIAANGALRAGCGLVQLAFPDAAYPAIAPQLPEAVLLPLGSNREGRLSRGVKYRLLKELQRADAMVIGCGMGVDSDTSELVYSLLRAAKCPVIVDADGINALALNINILNEIKAPLIFTPHPLEAQRLSGVPSAEIQANRVGFVHDFVSKHGGVLVLKGSSTLISDSASGRIYVNPTGNSGLARGGSGDLLSGIIGSLAAQGASAFGAASAGVYIHALAGDLAAARCTAYSSTVSECTAEISSAFKDVISRKE